MTRAVAALLVLGVFLVGALCARGVFVFDGLVFLTVTVFWVAGVLALMERSS